MRGQLVDVPHARRWFQRIRRVTITGAQETE
jgi:hypothetical protein